MGVKFQAFLPQLPTRRQHIQWWARGQVYPCIDKCLIALPGSSLYRKCSIGPGARRVDCWRQSE